MNCSPLIDAPNWIPLEKADSTPICSVSAKRLVSNSCLNSKIFNRHNYGVQKLASGKRYGSINRRAERHQYDLGCWHVGLASLPESGKACGRCRRDCDGKTYAGRHEGSH